MDRCKSSILGGRRQWGFRGRKKKSKKKAYHRRRNTGSSGVIPTREEEKNPDIYRKSGEESLGDWGETA